jgi:ubiquinone/menaquinone biosynthesis C-methylase UbiE
MNVENAKQELRAFYASEAVDLATEAWLEEGGTARVPESHASHYFIDRKVHEALALASLPRDTRVLEVGSSFGHMSFLLAERFREVVAVDLSPESIDLARRRAARYGVSNVRFEVADAERLVDFADGSFGGAFAFSTLRFCPDAGAALAELHRVLAPGGTAVVDVPNRDCPWYGPIKRMVGVDPHIHDRLYSAAEIRSMLEATGFHRVRAKHILFTTKRVPSAALPLFRVADRVLESLPGVRGMSGIVMAAGLKDAGG